MTRPNERLAHPVKMALTVAYKYFWGKSDNGDYLTEFLRHHLGDVRVVPVSSASVDILICSVMGLDSRDVARIPAKVKICYIGENIDPDGLSRHYASHLHVFDIVAGFHPTDVSKGVVRFPLWLTYDPFYEGSDFLEHVERVRQETPPIEERPKFAACIARHDRNGIRGRICDRMQKSQEPIAYPSDFRRNMPKLGFHVSDKLKFLHAYKYNICPENSVGNGYYTEKIFQALMAGCIPVYWAGDKPEPEILEEDAYAMFDAAGDRLDVEAATKHHTERKPLFKSAAKYIVSSFYSILGWRVKSALGLCGAQKITCVSYASGSFASRIKALTENVRASGYFADGFRCFTDKDFRETFLAELSDGAKEVFNSPGRGGGFWIWKPFVIKASLEALSEHDVLVYMDAGCSLNATDAARSRFGEYINIVNSHWSGMVRFRMSHLLENKFTNMATFDAIGSNAYAKYGEKPQLVGGVLVIRKCEASVEFFRRLCEFTSANPFLYTDRFNNGKMHRHDQSVASVMYRTFGGAEIEDETYFAGGFASSEASRFPIWATRRRV